MSEWQPIETAPKDQTVVLLYVPARFDLDGVMVGFWSDEGGSDWYDNEAASHSITSMYGPPTHWMPLPEPPK